MIKKARVAATSSLKFKERDEIVMRCEIGANAEHEVRNSKC